jgi:DNA (cytosine-5)-methyltransferase 1
MLMMSVPESFQWLEPEVKLEELSSYSEKNKLRSKTEKLIRESLGEAVPTKVMTSIARKIKDYLTYPPLTKKEVNSLIDDLSLKHGENLQLFIKEAETVSIPDLFKICDLANNDRDNNAAFHTSVDIAYSSIEYLPSEAQFKSKITALEPSVGAGVFVFLLAKKYPNLVLEFDCVDIDKNALKVLKALADRFNLHNLEINYIHDDFITTKKLSKRYDIVAGNPPFMKVKDAQLLKSYQGD